MIIQVRGCIPHRLLLVLILLAHLASSAVCYCFVSFSDVHIDEPLSRQHFRTAIATIKKITPGPQFILFTGDAFKGYTEDSFELKKYWEDWQRELLALNNLPVFSAIGNHEANLSYSLDGQEYFKRYWPQLPANGPPSMLGLTYYFDWDRERFIVLNTNSREWGYQLGEEQLNWLDSVLQHSAARRIMVAGHLPAYDYPDWEHGSLASFPWQRDRFWSLLQRYGVVAYICGHIHAWNHDGFGRLNDNEIPIQVVQGSFGFKSAPDQFPHFVLWDIEGNIVQARAFTPDGFFIDGFQWDGICKREIGPDLLANKKRASTIPNPCRDFLNVKIDTEGQRLSGSLDVRIYNIMGQQIAAPSVYHTSDRIIMYLKPLRLSTGNYFCYISLSNGERIIAAFTYID